MRQPSFLGPLVLVSLATGCGQFEKDQKDSAARRPLADVRLAEYPSDMPASAMGDRRLIGYWQSSCRALNTNFGAAERWTFLLDNSKAVLEQQVFMDAACKRAGFYSRSYMTFVVDGTTLESRIWTVHSNLQDQALALKAPLQNCAAASNADSVWYDLTDSACGLISVRNRGDIVIQSAYAFDSSGRRLRFEVKGRGLIDFTRQD